MAAAGIRPGSEGAALLAQEWDAEIRTKPTEEMVIANDFSKPKGVEKMQNQLNIRIIPVIVAQTLGASDQGQGSGLTYHTGTTTSVSATPTFAYGAVELPDHQLSKMTDADQGSTKAGYRKQLMAALNEKIDQTSGQLAASVSEQVGAPSNMDKALILDAKGRLATRGKNHVKIGSSLIHLKYHPTQIKHLESISEVMNAETRGGGDNPNVKGVLIKAWGLTLAETGNVYTAAGVAYNFMFVEDGFVLAYNLEPKLKDPQVFEFATRFLGSAEFGVAEIFDEDAVTLKSAA